MMDYEDLKLFDKKIVFIRLKNGTIFNAEVIKIKTNTLSILDKFNHQIILDFNEISLIEEREVIQ